MAQGDFYAATAYFEEYLKRRPKDYKIAFQLGESYRNFRDYEDAQKWYKEAFDRSAEEHALSLYYYALMLKMNGKCNLAKENFLKFKKLASGNADLSYYYKQYKNEIAGCDSIATLENRLAKISVSHLDTTVNKINVEHAPLQTDHKTLIYSSLRSDKKLYKYDNPDSVNRFVRKFYKAEKKDDKWIYAGELEGPFNNPLVNTTNGTYSADGKRFYFTRCEPNWKNKMICSIWVSEKGEDGSWANPVKLDKKINNPKYTSTQPAAGMESVKGNEVVYFVSDRPDGRGGLDIWYFIYDLKKKTYLAPKNAGNKVNTTSDEVTPYYDMESHALYFSSNGWPGIGGLDVFKAHGEMKKFSPANNIGAPVNSNHDDLYYTEGKSREEGFFVSNRIGGIALSHNPTCCDDIYSFKRLEYVKLNAIGLIHLSNDSTNEKAPIDGATVSLYMIDPREPEPVFIKKMTVDPGGKYDFSIEPGFDYKLVAEKDGFLKNSAMLNTKDLTKSQTVNKDVPLTMQPEGVIRLKNVYYDFNKAELQEQSKPVLDTTLLPLLQENPTIKIEISSHTDDKGSDDYNMKLSQGRAESVVNYLVSKGIEKNRLVAKGYGETKPIAPNKKPDGTDNPEGREMNRRTEFKIIGKVPMKKVINEADDY